MTNDTDFAEHIANPSTSAENLPVEGRDSAERRADRPLAHGIELSDGPTRPAEVKRLRDSGKHTFLEMTITEGRNRQVRRMIDAWKAKCSNWCARPSGNPHRRPADRKVAPLTAAEVRALAGPR